MTIAAEAGPTKEVRPYGFLGLTISIVLILVSAALLCLALAALAFGGVAIVLGWHPALAEIKALLPSIASDGAALQRAGVVVSIVVYAAVAAMIVTAARIRGGVKWRDLIAWHAWHPLRGTRLFWFAAAAMVVYGLVADQLVAHFYPPSRDWVNLPKGPLWVGLFFILAVIMAPLAEELLFRGWLYTSLRAKIGVTAGVLVTAILFAIAHWEASHLYALAVFPVGLALGIFRERTGSLLASMTFHALYNGAAMATLAFSN